MTIIISKKIERELRHATKRFGVSREDFLMRALLYYLQAIEKK